MYWWDPVAEVQRFWNRRWLEKKSFRQKEVLWRNVPVLRGRCWQGVGGDAIQEGWMRGQRSLLHLWLRHLDWFMHALAGHSHLRATLSPSRALPGCGNTESLAFVESSWDLVQLCFKRFNIKQFSVIWKQMPVLFSPTSLNGIKLVIGFRLASVQLRIAPSS